MARDLRKLLWGMTQEQRRELFILLLQHFSPCFDVFGDFSEQDAGTTNTSEQEVYINPVDEMQSLAENLKSAKNQKDIQLFVEQIKEQAGRIPRGDMVIRLCTMFKYGDATRADIEKNIKECAKWHDEVFKEIEALAQKHGVDRQYDLIKIALQIF